MQCCQTARSAHGTTNMGWKMTPLRRRTVDTVTDTIDIIMMMKVDYV